MKLGERISFANKNRHGSAANKWSGKIMELKNSRVYMGKPSYEAKDIPLSEVENLIDREINVGDKSYKVTTVLMGVPHTVIFETDRE